MPATKERLRPWGAAAQPVFPLISGAMLRGCLAAVGLGVLPVAVAGPATLDTVQQAAGQLSRIRAETARADSEWRTQRETLEGSLTALRERVRQLELKSEQGAARAAADTAKSDELAGKIAVARRSLAAAGLRQQEILEKLAAVRPSLPPRLSAALELPYRSIADGTLGPAERMRHGITILSRCAQFNKSCNFGEEVVVTAEDPAPRLLEVMYWGLSHAYALDRPGHRAYLGRPGGAGWTWEASPAATEAISRLIAVYQEKAAPAFIEIPAQLSHPAAATAGK